MTGISSQDIKGQFSGYNNYLINRQKIKNLEDEKKIEKIQEKEKKERSRDKKKKDKENNKEEEGLSDNGGVFDFLKCVLHLNPRSRYNLDDVKKLALFQNLPPWTSRSSSAAPASTAFTTTMFKASLSPQASQFTFYFYIYIYFYF